MQSPEQVNVFNGKKLNELYLAGQRFVNEHSPRLSLYDMNFSLIQNSSYDEDDLPPIRSMAHLRDELRAVSHRFDPSSPDGEFLRSKPLSTVAMLEALETKRLGKVKPFPKYLGRTYIRTADGIDDFQPVPKNRVNAQFQRVDGLAGNIGFKMTPDGWNWYRDKYRIAIDTADGKAEFVKGFTESRRTFARLTADFLGTDPNAPYSLEFDDYDKSWIVYVKGDRTTGAQLQVNTHPQRTAVRWNVGTDQQIAGHEGNHIDVILAWKRQIDQGAINQALGMTNIPGGEQWLEGLANNFAKAIPGAYDALDDLGKFAYELVILSEMIKNNLHYLSMRGKLPRRRDEVVEEVRQYLPGETRFRIDRFLNQVRYSPFDAAYRADYENGTIWFEEHLPKLSIDQLTVFMQTLFFTPMLPNQIKSLYKELTSAE